MDLEQDNTILKRPTRRREEQKNTRFMMLRNILNIIFMLGAIVGVVIYLQSDELIGTYVILCSMLFKIVECVFRFVK